MKSKNHSKSALLTSGSGNMDVLAQNIATTFADSGDKMANNVENIMTKSSKQYLEDFSQKHNNAIASIQTMAENIAEALSDKGIQAVPPQKVNQ
jgi:urocanate hydratase